MSKFIGIDCGSSYIKAVLYDINNVILKKIKRKTLFPVESNVKNIINELLNGEENSIPICITGYGRHHMGVDAQRITEIRAHFLGAKHEIREKDFVLVDIGGEDSKIVFIENGEIKNFLMNRKCAAGTGAFLEEFASRLGIKLDDFSSFASRHDKEIILNSFCTVFAIQESIKLLMSGEKLENLIYALYQSIAKRILEMALIDKDTVIFSGGVMAHNPFLVDIFKKRLSRVVVLEDSEFSGAIGAALHLIMGDK